MDIRVSAMWYLVTWPSFYMSYRIGLGETRWKEVDVMAMSMGKREAIVNAIKGVM